MTAVVFWGPSGAGKSSLIKRLIKEHPNTFALTVSHTTRAPRLGEIDGREYHFVSSEEMNKLIEDDQFIEHAQFSGNMYGTSKRAAQDVLSSGRICLLDVDIRGVKNLKKSGLNALYLSVQPPSLTELERRLRARGTETEESLQLRLKAAKDDEMDDSAFDYLIVNDNFEHAYDKLKQALASKLGHRDPNSHDGTLF